MENVFFDVTSLCVWSSITALIFAWIKNNQLCHGLEGRTGNDSSRSKVECLLLWMDVVWPLSEGRRRDSQSCTPRTCLQLLVWGLKKDDWKKVVLYLIFEYLFHLNVFIKHLQQAPVWSGPYSMAEGGPSAHLSWLGYVQHGDSMTLMGWVGVFLDVMVVWGFLYGYFNRYD